MKKFKFGKIKRLSQDCMVSKWQSGFESWVFLLPKYRLFLLRSLNRCVILESATWSKICKWNGWWSVGLFFSCCSLVCKILEKPLNLPEPRFPHTLDEGVVLSDLPGPCGAPDSVMLWVYAAKCSLLASVPLRVAWLCIVFFFQRSIWHNVHLCGPTGLNDCPWCSVHVWRISEFNLTWISKDMGICYIIFYIILCWLMGVIQEKVDRPKPSAPANLIFYILSSLWQGGKVMRPCTELYIW